MAVNKAELAHAKRLVGRFAQPHEHLVLRQRDAKRLKGLVESKSVVADKAREFKQRLSVLDAFGDL